MTNLPIVGKFRITATFGQQGSYWKNGHKGIDIVCDDRNIYATCNGKVRYIGFDPDGWGRYVDILDSQGNRHIFCHLQEHSVKVSVGQEVNRSTLLGTMGTTGNSSGVHLHYQINNKDNQPIDPTTHLGIPNEKGTYDSSSYEIPTGWQKDDKGWKYFDSNGYAVTNNWVKDSATWCYIGPDGYCVKDTWQKDSVGWCYLDSEGRLSTNTWKQDSNGWCYIDNDGHALKNSWKQLEGRWYYFNDSMNAVKGIQKINNKYFYFAEHDASCVKEYQLVITNANGEIQ